MSLESAEDLTITNMKPCFGVKQLIFNYADFNYMNLSDLNCINNKLENIKLTLQRQHSV